MDSSGAWDQFWRRFLNLLYHGGGRHGNKILICMTVNCMEVLHGINSRSVWSTFPAQLQLVLSLVISPMSS